MSPRLKVLIMPDKFKGTMSAGEAARAIARGWAKARPHDSIELLPMSDGGDGFGEVLGEILGAETRAVRALDAAKRRCTSKWWWQPDTRTAVIESAAVIGLAMLPHARFHPFDLDSFGLGSVISAAAKEEAKRCILGIGGSATNDGGFGVARALGWEFLDRAGTPITRWIELDRLETLRPGKKRSWFRELIVAVDVQNPLLGRHGATRVYGPQKGLRSQDFRHAEKCLRRLAAVVKKDLKMDLAKVPGAGAAGGLGFGLLAFLGARLTPGFELFAHTAQFDAKLRNADCVITGEGAIDRSTLMGKGVSQVMRRCREFRVPCIGLAGVINVSPTQLKDVVSAHSLDELTTIAEAKAQPATWLERLAYKMASSYQKPGRTATRANATGQHRFNG